MGAAVVGALQALALGLGVAVVAVAGLALAERSTSRCSSIVDSIGARGLAAWVGVGLLVADIVLPALERERS